MKVVIKNMQKKPEHCADCPICDYEDDCLLQTRVYDSWDEQYAHCPLQELLQPDPFNKVVQLLKEFDLESEWDGDIKELAQYICDMFKDGPYDPEVME